MGSAQGWVYRIFTSDQVSPVGQTPRVPGTPKRAPGASLRDSRREVFPQVTVIRVSFSTLKVNTHRLKRNSPLKVNTSRPNSPLKVNTLTNSKTNSKEPVIGATTTVDKLPDQENQEGGCLRGKRGELRPGGGGLHKRAVMATIWHPTGFSRGRALRNGIALLIRLAIAFCNAVRGPFLFRPHTDHSPWSSATGTVGARGDVNGLCAVCASR